MTTIKITKSSMGLTELYELAGKDLVVLRKNGKVCYALVRMDEGDLEALSLSRNPDFMAMLDKSRAHYETHGGFSLEEVKRRFGKRRPRSTVRKRKAPSTKRALKLSSK